MKIFFKPHFCLRYVSICFILLFTQAALAQAVNTEQGDIFDQAISRNLDFIQKRVNRENVNQTNVRGRSLLYYAVLGGGEAIPKFLLEKGADPNLGADVGSLPLNIAIEHNNQKLIKLLLEHGADPSRKLKQEWVDWTPLHFAVFYMRHDALEILLKYNPDINAQEEQGHTALIKSIIRGNYATIKSLVDAGADIELASKDQLSPIMWALAYGDKPVVDLLQSKGANINPPNADDGVSALMLSAKHGYLEIAKQQIRLGSKIDHQSNTGRTPLLLAIEHKRSEMVTFLLDMGASVSLGDNDGLTPLLMASKSDDLNMVKLLISKGIDVNHVNKLNQTALFYVSGSSIISDKVMQGASIVDYLLSKGIDIDHQDSEGRTALIDASDSSDSVIVTSLIKHGANPVLKDKSGHKALYYLKGRVLAKGSDDLLEKYEQEYVTSR